MKLVRETLNEIKQDVEGSGFGRLGIGASALMLPIQEKLPAEVKATAYTSLKINDHLKEYHVINPNRKAYKDIYVTDKDDNVLFGDSADDGKFNYKLEYVSNLKSYFVYSDRKERYGAVETNGRKIILKAQYDIYESQNEYTTFYDNEHKQHTSVVDEFGRVILKDNTEITHFSSTIQDDIVMAVYKRRGDDKRTMCKMKEFKERFPLK